jgi:coenzyme F420-0:L-glutamate ligase/coenzyme F420-1:gamma-L-glutamate ligase
VKLEIFPIPGIPEVRPGMDLAREILIAMNATEERVRDGDIFAVAQKIVSKAEGRLRYLPDILPGPAARELAAEHQKDPRVIELLLSESRRLVRAADGVIIAETHHGFVCANAGIDRSNAGAPDTVVLLPADPDASATRLRADLMRDTGVTIALVITDTFGGAWREGQTNVAIGMSGLPAFVKYLGQRDPDDYELRVTEIALGDEIAGATELVMGKLSRQPVAIVRGLAYAPDGDGARTYVRPAQRDLFR